MVNRAAYTVVRGELEHLKVPWGAIIGDHDVHERIFANFKEAMSEGTHYAFTVGALEAWPEHGLLGTQLGPNKNGKKW